MKQNTGALNKQEETTVRSQVKPKCCRRRYYTVFSIVIMACLGTVYSWSIFRTDIESLYGIGTALSGLPYMISLLFYSLFVFITGRIGERYSPKAIIVIGGILVAAGWILAGTANNILSLTLFYGSVIGCGVGIVYGVPMNMAAKWFPEKRGLITGMILAGFGASPFITAPFARYLSYNFGVLKTFQILGVIFGITIVLPALFFRYPTEEESRVLKASSEGKGLGTDLDTSSMVKTGSFKRLYVMFMTGTMIGLMMVGITSNVGQELIHLPASKTAVLMSLFAVFNGMGRLLFGWLSDRYSYRTAMILSYVLINLGAVIMLVNKDGNLLGYITAFSLFWLTLGGWLAIAPAATMSLYGVVHYSKNYGTVFTAYGIGAIAGVLLSGFFKDIFHGYRQVFYMIIVLSLTGIGTAIRFQKGVLLKQS